MTETEPSGTPPPASGPPAGGPAGADAPASTAGVAGADAPASTAGAASPDAPSDREPPWLGAVRDALADLPPERAGMVVRLVEAAYRRERLSGSPAKVAARFADAFAFVDGRRAGTPALRVFNPEPARTGTDGTVVEANVEDHPFILSTLTEELARQGLEPAEVLHPVIGVERDRDGRVVALGPARGARNRESFIHLVLDHRLPSEALAPLARDLERVLGDARRATRDFEAMKQRARDVAGRVRAVAGRRYPEDEVDEAVALIDWLLDDHFVLLGFRAYQLVEVDGALCASIEPGSGLGILADESTSTYARPVPLEEVPADLRERMEGGSLLTVARTNRRRTVHRQVRMVYIGLKRVGDDGRIVGEDRFLGLFAQKAFAQPASSIPVLRRKLRQIVEREDVVEHSHDERALRTLFEAFPKPELFALDIGELQRTLVTLLETQKHQRVRVLVRVEPHRRSVSVLVAVPRERFNATLRMRIQDLLVRRFEAGAVDYHLSMTERDQALMHFLLHVGVDQATDAPVEELEREVLELTRTWDDAVRDVLAGQPAGPGLEVASRWLGRFPPGYQAMTDPATAVADIIEMERLLRDGADTRMALQRASSERPIRLRFKLYRRGQGVELSGFLPILESLGFVVVEEIPHHFRVATPGGEEVTLHLHDFGVRLPGGDTADVATDGPRMAAAAQAVWEGRAEADALNRLVLRAGLEWDDVAVLRAYRRYRRQVGTSFTEAYQDEALVRHPAVARALMELFAALFDPDADAGDTVVDAVRRRVHEALEEVERLDQDRILRGMLGLVEATLRTNRYVERTRERGSPALALKIDSTRVPSMARPVPHVETFVYSPEVEGLHLRGGLVARGGIRWSDRREDFRAEVLGLMKAQVVKNAVIVPTGAKGGFVLKRPPAGAQRVADEVRRQYEAYVRALLDITGDVSGGEVAAPPRVRRRDGDDPYLVVAPDRGTAALSDLANEISSAYSFWLGDAFASGGSRGYDHKAMGITARGAWVAVQRHFRELGTDVQTESVRVVGIGDMSGDVFGNGMLQSRAIKLVAAFDHRHVFLDPDPDPEVSWRERKRLYDLPRSSWDDYDRALISRGGGVWSRSAKAIALSEEARAVLRVDDERLSPPEVVRAILRAPVDLLFAGGIGTFVKASDEDHGEVGDRGNDPARIDASELGARVVGEGANLALTQRARIQYSRRGGRCNSDAIDNSAGVETSDREVNLKILLRLAQEEGALAPGERDALLASLTEDVGDAALRTVYLQTWRISQEVAESPGGMEAYEQLMEDLAGAGGVERDGRPVAGRLDRAVEGLPAKAEMRRRREAGAGLTRPELAVLLAYAKIDLRNQLLTSRLVDDPELAVTLASYFPQRVAERFAPQLRRHRLRRELVATRVAGDLVDRMGITYARRACREFGVTTSDVAAAYWAAREVCDADRHWRDVEALDPHTEPALQLELKGEIDRLVDGFVRAYLRRGPLRDVRALVERDQPVFAELAKVIADLGSTDVRARRWARAEHYTGLGIDDELAQRIVALTDLVIVPDVSDVARRSDAAVRHVAELFFHLSEVLPFTLLQSRLREVQPTDRWERWQQRGLLDELRQVRRDSAVRILDEAAGAPVAEAVHAFLAARAAGRERLTAMVDALQREPEAGLSAIAVTVRVLREALVAAGA